MDEKYISQNTLNSQLLPARLQHSRRVEELHHDFKLANKNKNDIAVFCLLASLKGPCSLGVSNFPWPLKEEKKHIQTKMLA